MSLGNTHRPWLRRAVLLGTGLCLALMVGAVNRVVHQPSDRLALRLSDAERNLFYRLTPGHPVHFSLPAGVQRIRVISHLVAEPPLLEHPELAFLYALSVRQEAMDGTALRSENIHLRSRLSRSGYRDGAWSHENSFTLEPGVTLADRRLWDVELADVPTASQLRLELPAQQGEVWVMVLIPTKVEDPHLELLRLAREESNRQARRISFTTWTALLPEQRLALVDERWERLAADGSAGTNYEVRTVYFTGFQPPAHAPSSLIVWRTRPAAIPIQGPASLELRVGPVEGRAASDATLTATLLGPDGAVPLGPGGDTQPRLTEWYRLEVPPGLHSLELRTDAFEPLTVSLSDVEDVNTVWRPERRRVQSFPIGPQCPAARLVLAPGEERLLRVTARGFRSPPEEGPPVELEVTAEDARGEALARERLRARLPFAPFERAHRPLPHPSRVPCAQTRTESAPNPLVFDAALDVSEPATFYVQLPPGTEQIVLRAPHPLLLSAFTFLPEPGAPLRAAPFEEKTTVRAPWRHAPLLRRMWHPLRPFNLSELELTTGAVSLEVQVRREPGPLPSIELARASRAVEPLASPEQQLLLEPVADASPLVGHWEPGVYTLLSGEGPVVLDFDTRVPEAPTVRYALPPGSLGSLGAPVVLRQEGKPWHRLQLLTTSGREQLPPLPPGRHRVEVVTPARELRVLINRPPAPGEQAPVFRVRTVHALQRALTVAVHKPEETPVRVTAMVYATTPEALEAARLRLRVDGKEPRLRDGLVLTGFTPLERELTLPAATGAGATFLQRTGQPPLHGRSVGLVLDGDLSPGQHTVTLEAHGAPGLWARFLVTPLEGSRAALVRAPDGVLELSMGREASGEEEP